MTRFRSPVTRPPLNSQPLPRRLLLHVTGEDLRLGSPGDCKRCAVGRAAQRVLDLSSNTIQDIYWPAVVVSQSGIGVGQSEAFYVPENPRQHSLFLRRYDNWKHVGPCTLVYWLAHV